MNKHHHKLIRTLCLLFLFTITVNAQYLEQKSPVNDETKKRIDITSKANELGISTNQLQEILNSASSNSGGDPLPDAMQERFLPDRLRAITSAIQLQVPVMLMAMVMMILLLVPHSILHLREKHICFSAAL